MARILLVSLRTGEHDLMGSPPYLEIRVSTQPAHDFGTCDEPVVGVRVAHDSAHHLNQAVLCDNLRLAGCILGGDGEEQLLLVPEVVEDRTPGLAGRFLEP